MTAKQLSILEKAYVAEIDAALGDRLSDIIQDKSKTAIELVNKGYLQIVDDVIPGRFAMHIRGFRLTHLGRITYCLTCE